MLSVVDARARAARTVERAQRAWAAAVVASDPDARLPDAEVLEFVLRPPTEKAALADQGRAIRWVEEWRQTEQAGETRVTWVDRNWPSIGTQRLPERASLHGAEAIAAFAGPAVARSWRVIRERAEVIRDRLAPSGGAGAVAGAVRAQAIAIGEYPVQEFDELLQVVEWLVANPASGRRIRELPIRGIHTKWLERRRKVVEDLYRAVTGRDGLGLAESQSLIRVRFLDARLRPGGLTDVSLPLAELRALDIAPHVVFVFENLETVLAMPELSGAVVVHGGGYAVGRLADVDWIAAAAAVVYWGDLDSDGFRILDSLRSSGLDVTSIFMDSASVERYRDLAVAETRLAVGSFESLTAAEDAGRVLLQSEGGLRIEQERIAWADVMPVLESIALRVGVVDTA